MSDDPRQRSLADDNESTAAPQASHDLGSNLIETEPRRIHHG